jgi:hypothetical protein
MNSIITMRKVLNLKPYTRPLTCQAIRCALPTPHVIPIWCIEFLAACHSCLYRILRMDHAPPPPHPPPPHSHLLPLTMKYLITGSTQKFKPFTLLDVCIMCKMHSFHLAPRFFSQRGGVKGSVQRDCLLPAFWGDLQFRSFCDNTLKEFELACPAWY